LCDPQWLDNVEVTPQLIYRYQMSATDSTHVLNNDMKTLKEMQQVK